MECSATPLRRRRTFYNGTHAVRLAGARTGIAQLERHLQPPVRIHAKGVRMARRKMDWEDPAVATEELLKGHDVRSLGPGDSSDTGADMMGLGRGDDTSDRYGTGERASVEDDPGELYAADIATDRVVEADGAGLGGGLDQAEEAQLGITDEEIAALEDEDEDS